MPHKRMVCGFQGCAATFALDSHGLCLLCAPCTADFRLYKPQNCMPCSAAVVLEKSTLTRMEAVLVDIHQQWANLVRFRQQYGHVPV